MRVAEEAVEVVVDAEDMVEDAEAVDMVAAVAAMEVVDTEAAVMVGVADMEEADHTEVVVADMAVAVMEVAEDMVVAVEEEDMAVVDIKPTTPRRSHLKLVPYRIYIYLVLL